MNHSTPASASPRSAGPQRGLPGLEHPNETSKALLAAGRKLFAMRGFDGTSVRAITREAGTNLGAITYHFGSKRNLYAAVLHEELRPLVDRIESARSDPGTPLDRITLVMEAFFRHARENPDLPRLMLQEIAAGRRPPQVVVELIRRIARTLAGLHGEGATDGSLRPGNSYLTAVSVVAQPVYLTLVAPLFREVTGMDLWDPRTFEQAIAHTASFIRAGLESREEAPS